MKFAFGTGTLWGCKTNADGTQGSIIEFGGLQGVSVDISATVKELYGSGQYPIAVARATGKIAIKADSADIRGDIYNDLMFSNSTAAAVGQKVITQNEVGIVSSSGVITVAGSATWTQDYGVKYALTGVQLTEIFSGTPTQGQYTVSNGVYTFAPADENVSMYVSYLQTVATGGHVVQITNQLLGSQTFFFMTLQTSYGAGGGDKTVLHLNRCLSSKLSFATKTEDFLIPSFEASAFSDDAGNIGWLSIPQ